MPDNQNYPPTFTQPPTPREAAHNRHMAEVRSLERRIKDGTDYQRATYRLRCLEQEPGIADHAAGRAALAMARLACAVFAPFPIREA